MRGFVGGCACICGGSGGRGGPALRSYASVAWLCSGRPSPLVRPLAPGACRAIRRFNRRCVTRTSTRSAFRAWLSLRRLKPIEPPWYVTRMPGGVGGAEPQGSPLSRPTNFVAKAAPPSGDMLGVNLRGGHDNQIHVMLPCVADCLRPAVAEQDFRPPASLLLFQRTADFLQVGSCELLQPAIEGL